VLRAENGRYVAKITEQMLWNWNLKIESGRAHF
jgi:hypothetical protein